MSLGHTPLLLRGGEIRKIKTPEPLIHGVLDTRSTAVLFGPSGVGKSIVALDWALCIATGIPWDGHDTEQGKVIYVLGEGAPGTVDRYVSWCRHRHVDEVNEIIWMTEALNITIPKQRDELLGIVQKEAPKLVVLDTVARHIVGGDENSFETMGQMVDVMDAIVRVTPDGTALAIHHAGKAQGAGARGHSSLRAAVDTEIRLSKGPSLTVEKQKNHEDGHSLGAYRFERVGRSVVLLRELPENLAKLMGVLGDQALTGPEWMVQSGVAKATFYKWAKALLLQGQVVVVDGQYQRSVS